MPKPKVFQKEDIICKDCKKPKPAFRYHYRLKDGKWTLDSRTCLDCKKEDVRINRLHRKKHTPPTDSRCQCCGMVAKLHLDHSHTKSKRFRGWLCRKCNVGIGNLGDSIIGIKKALKYLQKTS